MNAIHRIEAWGNTHHPVWADYLRIPFGTLLVIKGLFFIYNSTVLVHLMQQYNLGDSYLLAYLISWVHIIGGVFLAIGLFTRTAALVQLPILVGAVFFVNTHRDMSTGSGEFFLSIIVLLLLLFYLIEGPGKFSLDSVIRGKTWTIKEQRGENLNRKTELGTQK